MQFMQVSDREWSDFKSAIQAGSTPVGACMVFGPSKEIAVQAQAVLMDAAQQEYRVRYFLCSDSGLFRVPCFLPLTGKEVQPEPFDASHYLAKRLRAEGLIVRQIMGRTIRELEHSALSEAHGSQLVVIEYLTPPSTLDLTFTLQLLKSAAPRNMPLVMLCHQQPVNDQFARQSNDTLEHMLSVLYLCGGHMRQADWHTILELLPAKELCEYFISTRRAGGDTWVCYANSQVAGIAEKTFNGMEPARKRALARAVVQRLPHDSSGYPLLAIAAETHDLKAMLAVYSHEATETALVEPKALVRYFERLRQVAQAEGDTPTTDMAYLLSLYSQVYLNKSCAVQAYQKLRGALPGSIDPATGMIFWYMLAEALAIMDHPEGWEYAAECFRLSRECVKHMNAVGPVAERQNLAAIANGEALIAFKQHQGEKARQLEEFAVEQLKKHVRQVHLKTNLGDVYLRLFGDVEAALMQYGGALLAASWACKNKKQPVTQESIRPLRLRAAIKMGYTLMQVGRDVEAMHILEQLLHDLEKSSDLSKRGAAYAGEMLKTRLALAQVYLKLERQRDAALCYWRILRHPQWLAPEALRDVIARLHDCCPGMHDSLRNRMERIVCEQEMLVVDATKVQEMLAEMQYHPACAMVA
ncbi:MAG TPA: hypothetical protein VNG51_04165 [Ktedonobacteraceae bacterium]|nr:hypothetical protein [Ktedonobacteraceae bacterium]